MKARAVHDVLQQKIALEDTAGAVPRHLPFSIDLDGRPGRSAARGAGSLTKPCEAGDTRAHGDEPDRDLALRCVRGAARAPHRRDRRRSAARHPASGAAHSLVASVLGAELLQPFHRGRGGPGGWWILDEPEVHFITKIELTVPDIAGWRRERLPAMPSTAFFELVPDWLCEIASPSTARYDRFTNLSAYERHGVPLVWLVDPVERRLEVHAFENRCYVCDGRISGDGPIRQPPFAEVAIDPPWLELWLGALVELMPIPARACGMRFAGS